MPGTLFTGHLKDLIDYAESGSESDVDTIFSNLTKESSFAETRFVDFALSLVSNPEGKNRIKHYLFKGTQIQRNYACLFFNRLGEYQDVEKAYHEGLIDEIQAFAR